MTTAADRVKDLFSLPESIHKIGFVEQLSRAVEHPQTTAETYVATPGIVVAFDRALSLVAGALRDGMSRAAYLHGSFGSGKSHFLALLSLLLSGEEHAWRIPELHPLRDKYPFAGKAKILQLRFHMIGHTGTIESAIFGRYVDEIRELHPTADLPGFFADEQLFDDARRMLGELGEERFFAPMNTGKKGDDAWGDIGAADVWTLDRFDAATTSTDPKVREELFNALVKTRFAAFAGESRQFVELDEGLATLSRHARGLGYDAVLLFLDELILWLASRSNDLNWFHPEVQKLVKLVEAQDARRDVPIVSFIARQRDIAELVGRDHEGLQNALVRDSLAWSEGRFDTIKLEDRNLPAIAEKRVLRPRSEEARAVLDQAFRTMKGKLGDAGWRLLLGDLDEKESRRLYPFNPVLMDALVALSSSLQRERTAIRLLTELMVEHIEDLHVGDVVGVGDLYDALAGGDDSTDGIMRARFDSAKQLYAYQFLPVIQQANGTSTPARCQRLRPEHPARIGCSNCAERACRTDNRLVKTMLIAALVPERPAFKDLTASKLVQLNHGSLRAPIPGTEVNVVAQKLRTWASTGTIAQLQVGSQADPTVRVQLEGVDTGPILEQARQFNTPGARQKTLRNLLFAALGFEPTDEWTREHTLKGWRGTDREGQIVFANVRRLPQEELLCPSDREWQIVVDYPFDDEGFGPKDDEMAIEAFSAANSRGTWTLVWLPTFFSKEMLGVLGDLVVLDHILKDAPTTRQYVSHLSVENQQRAVVSLENLRNGKKGRLVQVLEQAYGMAKAQEGTLDLSNAVEKHLYVLKPGAIVRTQLAATLADAIDGYAQGLMEARHGLHPKFPKKLTKPIVEELVTRFGEIVDAEDKSIAVDRDLAAHMRGFLLELGLVRVTEDKAFLREDDVLQRLENLRQKKGLDRPEVRELRSWIDEDGTRGLQADALDLIVRCYARWSARTLMSGDTPYETRAGQKIPDYVVLERPDLPTHALWTAALNRAADFGITLAGRALHGDNLKRLEALVVAHFKPRLKPIAELPSLLEGRLASFGAADTDRMTTARSAEGLSSTLALKRGRDLVEVLAGYEPKTSGRAVAASVATAQETGEVLADDLVWGPLEQLRGRGDVPGAVELLETVAQALRQDELHVKLSARVRELAKQAQGMLRPPRVPQPPPVGSELRDFTARGRGVAQSKDALAKLMKDAEAALATAGEDVELTASIRVTWRKKQ